MTSAEADVTTDTNTIKVAIIEDKREITEDRPQAKSCLAVAPFLL